jgi:hypothetical protein
MTTANRGRVLHDPEPGVARQNDGALVLTCDRFAALDVLEFAQQELTAQPLFLSAAHLKITELHRHIHEEHCPTCSRWYRNAQLACKQLAPTVPRLPASRPPKTIRFAARGLGKTRSIWQDVPAVDNAPATDLDGLKLVLKWQKAAQQRLGKAAPPGWELTLQFPARTKRHPDGNDRERLKQFAGFRVRVEWLARGQQLPACAETRLALYDHDLVSQPRILPIGDPRKKATIALLLLNEGGGIDGA